MADTVAVMNHGRIEQQGPPEELYEKPRTAFVANFLGQSNLVAGVVVGAGAAGLEVRLDLPGDVRVRCPLRRAVAHDGAVVVGVRPEKVRLLRDGDQPEDGANLVGPGMVVDVAFTGVSTQYLVAVPGVGSLTVFSQNLDGVVVRAGEHVRLTWAVEHTFGLDGAEDLAAGRSDPTDVAAAPAAVATGRPAPVVGTGMAG